ncbi:MAG: glutamate--tRNA ligase [Pseudomonadota bacterium]
MSKVVTRFAPSPTGYLHIGGARTALFNWLYARAKGGTFLLRIEDTDRERSTPEATQAIYDGMAWLGLDHDGEAISQFDRADRHRDVAQSLLQSGGAYKCFATAEEIEAAREAARAKGEATLFQSPWRDADQATYPDEPYVIRLKAPKDGSLTLTDHVQGDVTWPMESFDDLVLLRSDGTPTYMLAVVVDDHDMGVTHVIRGDDHLINAGRQTLINRAMGWDVPEFAHIPLIHGDDGKKLSKRHGAMSVTEYRDMGYMPEAMRNYLARLGWSHGDDELFTTAQAIDWFDLKGIGKSPARLDFKKLDNVSSHHIKTAADEDILSACKDFVAASDAYQMDKAGWTKFSKALPVLRDRSKKLGDLLEKVHFCLVARPVEMDADAAEKLDLVSHSILNSLTQELEAVSWTHDEIFAATKAFATAQDIKVGQLAQPLRSALSGRTQTPSVFDMMEVLGRDESLARIRDVLAESP